MTNKFNSPLWIMAVVLQFFVHSSIAQIVWPAGQLLPTFPTPAQTQDLIILRESSSRWEAEGPALSHATGRLETDGWLCQSGIDAANQYMIYGPYDNSIPAGSNVAEFRMKVDNNTANNDPVVDIEVRNATTGQGLAFQTITRQQFSAAGTYVNFTLPFTMPVNNQSIELRVYWYGGSYIKVDWVGVQQNNSSAEMYLFASLKGIVNVTQPRIFSYEGDAYAEGQYTWLQSLGLSWSEPTDKWSLITKYRSEISGLIVYDPAQTATINLATMLAKEKKALIASPSLLARLNAAPYNLPVLLDLRGQFSSKLQVYQTIYNSYWPARDHRLLIGINPDAHKAAVREYATALGATAIWLDPNVAGESELLNSFLSSMPAGANYMGWWPEEGPGVERASIYGITTIASDWATNLTVHSGMSRTVNIKPIPAKPAMQNKIYVAFILSDGDNLQYVEHLMRKLWNDPGRGSVPMGWTLSPAMLDAMPGALNYYWQSSTTNDNLISGPSGYGYTYPNSWPNQTLLNQFVAKTEDYNKRAGLRVITVWNTITGGINQNVGQSFASYASSTLGLTGQNTGGGLSIYNSSLPGMALSCNYCTNEQAMKDHIASAASGWNGSSPRFIIIQAQPWQGVTPTSFKNVATSLNADYIVVRPDHIFQLIREANGLPINPGNVSQSPYSGVIPIPGTVQSENYDNGGEGIAYHDVDVANKTAAYRTDGVDIEACSEGGYNIDYSENGEWLEYTVNVATTGSYNLNARVAAPIGGTFHVEFDGVNVSGTMTVPNTTGWQVWQTVTKVVSLTAGQHIMRFFIDTKEFNTNYISFTAVTTTVPVTSVSISPTSASVSVGGTQQLTPTVLPTNATNKAVSYTTSNAAVATVNSSGLVTAIAAGTANIAVTTADQAKTATCAVTVTASTLTDITNLGGTITTQYTGSPANEGIAMLIDNSSSTKFLTFNASAWVQYQVPSGYIVTSYSMTSANDAAERDPLNWTLQGSTNGTTWATINTQTAQDFATRLLKRSFSFTNTTSYAYYRLNMTNNSGTILQLAELELFGVTGTTTIPVTGVTMSPTTASISVAGAQQLTATVAPTNATNKTVTWTTSNSAIATVSSSGLVTGVTAGTATITVTTQDGVKTATCAVTVTPSSSFTTTIQAESYSSMAGVATETTTDAGGGLNVGWIEAADWMAYPAITIPTAGTYTIEYRVASMSGGGSLRFELAGGTPIYGTLAVPSTGGWQTWTTIKHTVTLSAGSQSFAIAAVTGGWNINWFAITQGIKAADENLVEVPLTEWFIYPNPAQNMLYIGGLEGEARLEIYTITGKQLKQIVGNSVEIHDLQRGTYIIRITANEFSQSSLFTKE